MHPNEDDLQALLDGELGEGASDRIRSHLGRCDRCNSRKDAMELALREIGELLGSLDQESPPVSADDLIQLAQRRHIPSRKASRGVLWAASIAGLVTAGIVVAAAVPGSPIRELMERIVGGREEAPPPARATAEPWSQEAGVALVPDGRLEIVFETTQAEGSIELVMTGEDTAKVEVRSDSVGFVVGDGSIRVENGGARANYRISLPGDLPAVLIRVGDRTLYQKSGTEVLKDEFQSDGDARRAWFSALPSRE